MTWGLCNLLSLIWRLVVTIFSILQNFVQSSKLLAEMAHCSMPVHRLIFLLVSFCDISWWIHIYWSVQWFLIMLSFLFLSFCFQILSLLWRFHNTVALRIFHEENLSVKITMKFDGIVWGNQFLNLFNWKCVPCIVYNTGTR